MGTDCAVGKKYTALALAGEITRRGMHADFRATGQTGIFIAGGGICVDTVVADFISGAAEAISPAAVESHWDVIEGQGSLFHPSYAAVSLGLLHGSQPDALILCHEEGRSRIGGAESFAIPNFEQCLAANLAAARFTNCYAQFVGISLNTASLSDGDARACASKVEAALGLPVVDPIRWGVAPIVDRLISRFGQTAAVLGGHPA